MGPSFQDGVGAGTAAHLALSKLVTFAASHGLAREARALAVAISPSEQDPLLSSLRRVLSKSCDAEAVAALAAAEQALAVVHGLRLAPEPSPRVDAVYTETKPTGMSRVSAAKRDRILRTKEWPPLPRPKRANKHAWKEYIEDLITRGDDVTLTEVAVEAAGSARKLCDISGLVEETISRVRNRHRALGFSDESRLWLRDYLLGDPEVPPPLLKLGVRGRSQSTSIAPQTWVDPKLAALFTEKSDLLRRPDDPKSKRLGGAAVFAFCMKRYLERHPEGSELPSPPPPGTAVVRARVDPDVRATFDSRVGGPAHRADHLRAALAEGLPRLKSYETAART